MKYLSHDLLLSATDLSNFLGCRHRSALEMDAAAKILKKPHFADPLMDLLRARGLAHEKAYVDELCASGRQIVDLSEVKGVTQHVDATIEAMRAGTDVIVQGALRNAQWSGKPDLLLRTTGLSAFGDWSYFVADTKLSRETRAGTILQLGLYSEMLAIAQERLPKFFHVVAPDPEHHVHVFRTTDYAAYVRLVRDQLATTVARGSAAIAAAYYPEPVELCHICPWIGHCIDKRIADDDLSLVANISRAQRRELLSRGANTLTALGGLALPLVFKPDRGSVESYRKIREQARLQLDSRGRKQGLRAGIERYSIKNLEPLYGFHRAVELDAARRGLRAFEYALAIGDVAAITADVRATVEGYNRDDCVSTLRLRDWLEDVRRGEESRGTTIPRPAPRPPEPSEELSEQRQRIEVLRAQLLAGIDDNPLTHTVEHARWLLAHLLDFHRRENKAGWWKFFELCDSSDEDLIDEKDAVAGLVHDGTRTLVVTAKTNKPTGSVIDRYRYPQQEMEIRRGNEMKTRDGLKFGDVLAVDRIGRTLDVKKGKARMDSHPTAVFAHTHINTAVLENAIAAVGVTVACAAGCDGANSIARTLLRREAPRLAPGTFRQPDGDSGSDFAVATVGELRDTVLAIQGPPGSGKTYTGARMIAALVVQGKRVGVMASSHKVITNLLVGVTREATRTGATIRVAQKTSNDDADAAPAGITQVSENDEALNLLLDREADVLG